MNNPVVLVKLLHLKFKTNLLYMNAITYNLESSAIVYMSMPCDD
jgi:hypothetical protein